MRKDLILVAVLSGWTVLNASADSDWEKITIPEANRIRASGDIQSNAFKAAHSSITDEVTSSSDREIGAAQEFRGESPGTLGARGTIGQDATGFTGQERIGTLPPGRLDTRKPNPYNEEFDRANDEIKQRERKGEFLSTDPTGAGGPASAEIGRASRLDPVSKINSPATNSSSSLVPPGTVRENLTEVGKASDSGVAALSNNSAPKPVSSVEGITQPNNSLEDKQMSLRLRHQLLNTTAPSTATRLTSRQLQYVQVRASTSGEVTLSGTVATKEDRGEVESVVRSMPGVSSISNQLTIKGADGKTDNTLEVVK